MSKTDFENEKKLSIILKFSIELGRERLDNMSALSAPALSNFLIWDFFMAFFPFAKL